MWINLNGPRLAIVDRPLKEDLVMQRLPLAFLLAFSALAHPAFAQSSTDHSAHHPDQKEAPATDAGKSTSGASSSQTMMGGGMMKMMDGMPMSNMMPMMSGMTRPSDDCMGGMEVLDHVEGRIAFLRAELKITDAQMPAWNGFADAFRARAKTFGDLRTAMMSQAGSETVLDQLTAQEKSLSARLDATRAIKTALSDLVATFSDEQRKVADELLAPNLGMPPMGMRGGRMSSMRMQRGH
ncbi:MULTISPECIES: Spy/CpxP family protein refolding chaperone [unclassified Bradyrhizobium]|uniref:Spy/CpxP family protein refolding chaperone n=1 Tax=unclassified Bradyrhizobium TaxID=2631580 RepID=UPI00291692C5|nr:MULTISPECIES: Spy/CpxP family protein refolding chaperone [unclassified Bradyrhizobium]